MLLPPSSSSSSPYFNARTLKLNRCILAPTNQQTECLKTHEQHVFVVCSCSSLIYYAHLLPLTVPLSPPSPHVQWIMSWIDLNSPCHGCKIVCLKFASPSTSSSASHCKYIHKALETSLNTRPWEESASK